MGFACVSLVVPVSGFLAMAQEFLRQRRKILSTVTFGIKGKNRFAIDLRLVDRFRPANDRFQHVIS